MNYKTICLSDFYCTCCGQEGISVPRQKRFLRESGHLKRLYCPNCKKETNHAEVSPYGSYTKEDFEKEFSLGRFVNGDRIPIHDLFRCKKECKYNIYGFCWNANNSCNCEEKINK